MKNEGAVSEISTNRIVAFKALERPCGRECVDWAIGQIEAGHDDREVLVLAGMTPPFNHFEMAALRDAALTALGIQPISHVRALRVYAAEIASDALAGRAGLFDTLSELTRLHIEENYRSEFNDFYLLHFAWDDLRKMDEQWYWPGATRENIAFIAAETLRRFVTAVRDEGG